MILLLLLFIFFEEKLINIHIVNMEIHSGQLGDIEDFVETHICKLCVILRSRVLLGVCPHWGYRSAAPLGATLELVPGLTG